jgi:hypothetical protein
MSKIAPTLQHFVSARTCHQGECGGDAECEKVEKQLRALLAVASAANVWSLTAPVSPAFPGVENRLVKGLARLEKVSR